MTGKSYIDISDVINRGEQNPPENTGMYLYGNLKHLNFKEWFEEYQNPLLKNLEVLTDKNIPEHDQLLLTTDRDNMYIKDELGVIQGYFKSKNTSDWVKVMVFLQNDSMANLIGADRGSQRVKEAKRNYDASGKELIAEALLLHHAKLNNPELHIPRILAVGSQKVETQYFGVTDQYYVIQEFLESSDIRSLIRNDELTVDDIFKCFEPVSQVIDTISDSGGVHGDISEYNIRVDEKGEGWVIDFRSSPNVRYTRPTRFVGDNHLLSPEESKRAEDLPKIHEDDIYAFGQVLYRVITGGYCWTSKQDIEYQYSDEIVSQRYSYEAFSQIYNYFASFLSKESTRTGLSTKTILDNLKKILGK